MTFDERCARFEKNTEQEINQFKRAYRFVFLQNKIQEQKQLEDSLFAITLQNNEQQTNKRATK